MNARTEWKLNYCKERGLSPMDARSWDIAERAYRRSSRVYGNLRLRVTSDLSERITTTCEAHRLAKEDFCKRVARQMRSGRIIVPKVLKNKKRNPTTKYKIISVDNWPFKDTKGKRLVRAIEIAMDRLDKIEVKRPNIDLDSLPVDLVITPP